MTVGAVILPWLHLLCMVGMFGALLVLRLGLPAGAREDAGLVRSILRLATVLLVAGTAVGLAAYVARMAGDGEPPAQMHMVVGIKMLLMLAVGAGIGLSSAMLRKGRPGAANLFQWLALAALAAASLLGLTV